MLNPLEIRPNVACIIVPPKAPDDVVNIMANLSSELAAMNWWVRTGCAPKEIEIAKAADKKALLCHFRNEKIPVGNFKVANLDDLDPIKIKEAYAIFEDIANQKFGGINNIKPKHYPRAIEQLFALVGSNLNYSTCSRLLITWWPEKKHPTEKPETWPLTVEAVYYGRRSPENPFSSNIVNIAASSYRQSFDVSIPELRSKMESFNEESIKSMNPLDGSLIPF